MKIVEITWKDIIHESGWHDQDALDNFLQEKAMTVIQVAYLYEEDEDTYTFLDSYFADKETFGTIHVIPKGCVVSIKELAPV
jgi:hypothetical protein